MSKVLITEAYLEDIAAALRNKSGGGSTYTPAEMAGAILNLPSGGTDNVPKYAMGTIIDSEVDWSQITSMRDSAFYMCRQLTTVGNPTVRSLPNSCFRYCTGLTNAEITCTDILQTYCGSLFRNCTELLTAIIHFSYTGNGDVTFGDNYIFGNCSKLHTVILTRTHATKTIILKANFMFDGASALRNLVLKSPNMVTFSNGQNAYAWGGIWDNPTESTIYVPNALISSYQTATNWVTLYNRGVTFAKIEGSIYE